MFTEFRSVISDAKLKLNSKRNYDRVWQHVIYVSYNGRRRPYPTWRYLVGCFVLGIQWSPRSSKLVYWRKRRIDGSKASTDSTAWIAFKLTFTGRLTEPTGPLWSAFTKTFTDNSTIKILPTNQKYVLHQFFNIYTYINLNLNLSKIRFKRIWNKCIPNIFSLVLELLS